jgi:formamidopyrimidine-DNA glycosylase
MPELPEVETTRRGLESHIVGKTIERFVVREARLRWPIEAGLGNKTRGMRVDSIGRRGKYLLLNTQGGTVIVHLGMSGSLRYLPASAEARPHDHVDCLFSDGSCIRYNDPRRFGSIHHAVAPFEHALLRHLGPEPLGPGFNGEYLYASTRRRHVAIKNHIMNSHVVVGVGNIYANEALYRSGIHPLRRSGRISRRRIDGLVTAIRDVLSDAIAEGGTTLRDFVGGDGRPGYFKQLLDVYDREDQPCRCCETRIRKRIVGQRAAYYCPQCQR